MKAHVQYTREIHEKFGYLATWAPNLQLQLGDIGVLNDYIFEPVTTLARLGMSFETRSAGNGIDLDYASAGTTNIRVKLSGHVPPVGSLLAPTDAGVAIEFGAENAIVFQAANCQEAFVAATDELSAKIIAKFEAGDWPKEYVVITSLVSCDSATVLISGGQNARMDLIAKGKVGGSALALVDLTSRLEIVHALNINTKIVAATGLTPLFRASGLKKRFLGRASLTRRGGSEATRSDSINEHFRFLELDFEECD